MKSWSNKWGVNSTIQYLISEKWKKNKHQNINNKFHNHSAFLNTVLRRYSSFPFYSCFASVKFEVVLFSGTSHSKPRISHCMWTYWLHFVKHPFFKYFCFRFSLSLSIFFSKTNIYHFNFWTDQNVQIKEEEEWKKDFFVFQSKHPKNDLTLVKFDSNVKSLASCMHLCILKKHKIEVFFPYLQILLCIWNRFEALSYSSKLNQVPIAVFYIFR